MVEMARTAPSVLWLLIVASSIVQLAYRERLVRRMVSLVRRHPWLRLVRFSDNEGWVRFTFTIGPVAILLFGCWVLIVRLFS